MKKYFQYILLLAVAVISSTMVCAQSKMIITMKGGQTYSFPVSDIEKMSWITEEAPQVGTHEYVDLGLPSGTLWATCNVGASKPEEYGDYFAWGETEPKSEYSWSNYKWCNGNYYNITKYCTSSSYGEVVDNKTTLDLKDDAAHVNWGGDWRMPTLAEQQELIDNCIWTRTTLNGVEGHEVKSKTNGNSIFLPATGWINFTALYNTNSCFNWSSSLYTTSNSSAYLVYFSSGISNCYTSDRCIGMTVRPVVGSQVQN